jgi:hypothetical protein
MITKAVLIPLDGGSERLSHGHTYPFPTSSNILIGVVHEFWA